MIWWINYDFNWVRWLDEFHEHKISNTGWVRNGDEREGSGTERNQKECSTFLNLHFLDQKWSKDLELHLQNWEDSANPGKHTIYTVVSTDFTFQYAHKQSRKSMQWGEPSLKKGSALSQHELWRNLLAKEFATLPPKTTTSLWNEMKWKTRKMQSD